MLYQHGVADALRSTFRASTCSAQPFRGLSSAVCENPRAAPRMHCAPCFHAFTILPLVRDCSGHPPRRCTIVICIARDEHRSDIHLCSLCPYSVQLVRAGPLWSRTFHTLNRSCTAYLFKSVVVLCLASARPLSRCANSPLLSRALPAMSRFYTAPALPCWYLL